MSSASEAAIRISAFIVCMNEEKHIRRCLESVRWCDEIVVVDSGSTDTTVEICREYTRRIVIRSWPGFVEQKRFALAQCRGEWVLNVDSDEVVSPELKEEMLRVIAAPGGINGYYLPRVVYYLGKFWRKGGWYPEYRLRLCRRACTTWGGEDPHEKAQVNGPTGRLVHELHHFTYEDIANHIRSVNNFASVAADTLYRKGKRASLFNILFNPLGRFIKFYFLRLGFREGLPGFIAACIETFYVFLKYVKLWERERSPAQ